MEKSLSQKAKELGITKLQGENHKQFRERSRAIIQINEGTLIDREIEVSIAHFAMEEIWNVIQKH